jgi:hypothetical protein
MDTPSIYEQYMLVLSTGEVGHSEWWNWIIDRCDQAYVNHAFNSVSHLSGGSLLVMKLENRWMWPRICEPCLLVFSTCQVVHF